MTTVGFVRTSMPEESRVALLPKDIKKHIEYPETLFIEEDYAKHLGVCDQQYEAVGANVVSRTEAYDQDGICIPKPWADDLRHFKQGQTAMGWFYLAEKKELARAVIDKDMTVIGWQDMYDPDGNYAFEKNRWFAG